ncbi:MAG TPA: NRDE family protein, partial [Planctomycetota bacterium]|nr:NRDE family protein [Planctomycetota bacterium]
MCVLALWVGVDRDSPLVVAANRDESYDRPSEAPRDIEPGIVAGRDLQS